jgi:glutathione S-transferase
MSTTKSTEPDQVGSGAISVRLFTIPGSHPGVAVQLMLQHKGIPYKRTDLLPVISWAVLRALRFPRLTVPATRIDGRRVQGSIEITRELERIKPEPPLFPADPDRRSAVEKAERFADEDFQERIRQILLWAFGKSRASLGSYLEGAKIGLPHGLAVRTAGPFVALDARSHEASDDNVRRDISILPGMLQRIDDWIAEGVLGGEQLNAADFQIATCLRLAMSIDDLRPAIENRPAGELALRVVPHYPGRIPPVLPAAWLEPLHPGTPAL